MSSFNITTGWGWFLLLVAGLLEVVWVTTMKASDGYEDLKLTAITLVAAGISFWLLGLALEVLPVSTAYAVWTGIGAVGAAVLGMVLFHEPANPARLACIGLIVCGTFGLKWLR